MRAAALWLMLVLTALPVFAAEPVSDEDAAQALKDFDLAFRSKDLEDRQNAVYDLHDVPHDKVIARLARVLRDRDVQVRNVAALALGGQIHNPAKAGAVLLKAYDKEKKNPDVVASVLDAMKEVGFMGYWPDFKKALKDERSHVVIRTLDLLGANKDYRTLPELL